MSNNSQNKNTISVNAGLPTGNLTISVANLSQAVTATNNRAQYYADQAKKFLNETKELFESTKYYAEQNTDVTYGYIDGVKSELMLDYNSKLALKQNVGECLLIDDLPENVSAFNNDSGYLVDSDLDEVRFPIQTGNQGKYLTTDGTDVSWENMPVRNVGETVFSLLPLTDSGLHLLDGSLIDGSGIYSDFVNYIADLYEDNPSANYFTTEILWQQSVTTYGVCGKFVYDSVDNTVRLPKVTGFVEGTIDLTALGELTEAGLPNITGTFGPLNAVSRAPYATGAISIDSTAGTEDWGGGSDTYGNASFSASRSNSIYGNSSTVQPQAIKGFYYIVVATSQKTDIQVDIDEIATDLNEKLNIDLTNFPKPYLKTTYINGTSGYRIWSDGYCVQWGTMPNGNGVTFLKTFNDNNYNVIATQQGNASPAAGIYMDTKTPSYFGMTTQNFDRAFYWMASGYLAEGEY